MRGLLDLGAVSDTPEQQEGEISLIDRHAARVRASGVLGRSGLIRRLFDYLVACAEQGRVPKEIEVAIDGFGKDATFDSSQDALVRVYVHKLRRKLDEFYVAAGRAETQRIAIPRGEYRLVLLPWRGAEGAADPALQPGALNGGTLAAGTLAAGTLAAGDAPDTRWPRLLRREWLALGAIAALLALVIGLSAALWSQRVTDPNLRAVRSSAVWAPLLDDDLPIQIVLGDYYIFGERDGTPLVDRLVRDFTINSRADLEQRVQARPDLAQRYTDLNLGYLPTSSAYALREVLPVLIGSGKRVSITLASELDPTAFKTSHVVYIGYLSALGMLQEIVFAGSRFSIGASFDELIDLQTGTAYVSEAGGPIKDAVRYRDYAYFSTFKGPNGNQHVIIAGTRDTAVMQTAEVVAGGRKLAELTGRAGKTQSFEALYEVYSVNRTNIESRLLVATPLDTKALWNESENALQATALPLTPVSAAPVPVSLPPATGAKPDARNQSSRSSAKSGLLR